MIDFIQFLKNHKSAMKLSIFIIMTIWALPSCVTIGKPTVQDLIAVVTDPYLARTDRPQVVKAILQLGERDAIDAVPALSEKLDFHINADGLFLTEELPAVEMEYPAVQALLSIGRPGIPGIADALAFRERSETFVINGLYTIMEILDGNEPARKALQDLAMNQSDPEKRSRLEKARSLIPIVLDPDPAAITPRWE